MTDGLPDRSKVLYVRIDADIKADLDALAKEAGVTLTWVANIVLRKGLGQKWTPEYGVAKLIRLLQERDEPWETVRGLVLEPEPSDRRRHGSSSRADT